MFWFSHALSLFIYLLIISVLSNIYVTLRYPKILLHPPSIPPFPKNEHVRDPPTHMIAANKILTGK